VEAGARLELRIRIHDDEDGNALVSLHRWLAQDQDVTRWAAVNLISESGGQGDMGAAFDAITAVVSNSIGLGSLVIAYLSWRDSRSHPSAATIEHERVVINITDISPENVGRLVEALSGQGKS
jgi:hypothetical protein